MREFKFRVWDEESKIMLNWNEVQEQWEEEGYHPAIFNQDHYKCMQYIGKNDCNGVEIYEGDWFVLEDGIIGIIVYHEGKQTFGYDLYEGISLDNKCDESFEFEELLYTHVHKTEVMGNIYEKGGKNE